MSWSYHPGRMPPGRPDRRRANPARDERRSRARRARGCAASHQARVECRDSAAPGSPCRVRVRGEATDESARGRRAASSLMPCERRTQSAEQALETLHFGSEDRAAFRRDPVCPAAVVAPTGFDFVDPAVRVHSSTDIDPPPLSIQPVPSGFDGRTVPPGRGSSQAACCPLRCLCVGARLAVRGICGVEYRPPHRWAHRHERAS